MDPIDLAILAGVGWLAWRLANGTAGPAEEQPSDGGGEGVDDPGPDLSSPWGAVVLTDVQRAALAAIVENAPDFDAADLMAICQIESSWIPTAVRAEPQLGTSSYGLMQILETTARDRGFAGDVAELFDPATNVAVCALQLRWIKDYLARRMGRAGIADIVAAWNAGVGNVSRGFVPARYVGRWQAARLQWEQALARGVA